MEQLDLEPIEPLCTVIPRKRSKTIPYKSNNVLLEMRILLIDGHNVIINMERAGSNGMDGWVLALNQPRCEMS